MATLTGDNGLLQKATTAKKENEEAKELELIKLAVSAAQVEGKGTINTDNLNNQLKNMLNAQTKAILANNEWYYKTDKLYKISNNGKVNYKNILPSDFKQIEYIQSKGDQYIITDLIDNEPWKCNVTIEFTSNVFLRNCIFGCNYGADERFFALDNDSKIVCFLNGIKLYDIYKINLNTKYDIEYDCHNNYSVSINKENIYSGNRNYNIRANSPISLMACPRDGNFNNGSGYRSYAKCYYAEFYDNSYNLKHIFIPCKDKDEIVCMFDLITNKAFYNQGTGEFIAGPEV